MASKTHSQHRSIAPLAEADPPKASSRSRIEISTTSIRRILAVKSRPGLSRQTWRQFMQSGMNSSRETDVRTGPGAAESWRERPAARTGPMALILVKLLAPCNRCAKQLMNHPRSAKGDRWKVSQKAKWWSSAMSTDATANWLWRQGWTFTRRSRTTPTGRVSTGRMFAFDTSGRGSLESACAIDRSLR